jgi:hypothetical protein
MRSICRKIESVPPTRSWGSFAFLISRPDICPSFDFGAQVREEVAISSHSFHPASAPTTRRIGIVASSKFAKYIIPNPVIASAFSAPRGVSVFVGARGFLKAYA